MSTKPISYETPSVSSIWSPEESARDYFSTQENISNPVKSRLMHIYEVATTNLDAAGQAYLALREQLYAGIDDHKLETYQRSVARLNEIYSLASSRNLTPAEIQEMTRLESIVKIGATRTLKHHNELFAYDADYQRSYLEYASTHLKRCLPTQAREHQVSFRGIQDLPEAGEYIKPEWVFQHPATTPPFSLCKKHQGLINSPEIIDPCFATEEQRVNRRLCWTRGITSSSLDPCRGGFFSVGATNPLAVKNRLTRSSGFCYVTVSDPEETFPMNAHVTQELTDYQSGSAKTAFEIITLHMKPEQIPVVLLFNQDGRLSSLEKNPLLETSLKCREAYTRFNSYMDTSDAAVIRDMEHGNLTVFQASEDHADRILKGRLADFASRFLPYPHHRDEMKAKRDHEHFSPSDIPINEELGDLPKDPDQK